MTSPKIMTEPRGSEHSTPRVNPADSTQSILVGLIGSSIQESRSPALHEEEGQRQGLRYVYKLIDLDMLKLSVGDLGSLLEAAKRMGFAGVNVTHPCKQAVIPLLENLTPDARAVNAVNTVVFELSGRAVGHNTDWWGFAEAFRRQLAGVVTGRVVQLGAGGAGGAVAHALLTLGVEKLTIVDLDLARAQHVARALCERFSAGRAVAATDPAAAMTTADGLVNTTPVGMAKYPGLPVAAELLRPQMWVADIIYFPIETELLKRARALGCRTMSGGGMVVFQAAAGFRLFTGRDADADAMQRHFASMYR